MFLKLLVLVFPYYVGKVKLDFKFDYWTEPTYVVAANSWESALQILVLTSMLTGNKISTILLKLVKK